MASRVHTSLHGRRLGSSRLGRRRVAGLQGLSEEPQNGLEHTGSGCGHPRSRPAGVAVSATK
eukprot:21900-Eustigmatos_ZCMA.PRE.1